MGDRYILTVVCPKCGFEDDDCYFAPTCGFLTWKCPRCKKVVDLEEYSGISKESASNADAIKQVVDAMSKSGQGDKVDDGTGAAFMIATLVGLGLCAVAVIIIAIVVMKMLGGV